MTNEYNEIEVLKGLQGIRSNVGMYLSNTEDGTAVQQALIELISNSVDEYMNGYATKINVCLYKDGSCSVEDNGRGIPISWNEKENCSNLELAVARVHAGGKFKGGKNYNTSGGLHGVGAAACNAISQRFRVVVWRDGNEYTMAFAQGEKVEELSSKPVKRKQTGTYIRFAIDKSLFKNVFDFDGPKVYAKLKELSFLCQGLVIEYIDEKRDIKETLASANGLSDFVRDLAPSKLMEEPIRIKHHNGIEVDVALQWLDGGDEECVDRYYTNNIPNLDGGSHAIGFKSGLTRTLNNYIAKADLPKTLQMTLSGDDVREGLISVVAIKHPSPSYSSQTKDKLVSEDARTAVESAISDKFGRYLEENPTFAKKLVNRVVASFKAREAARKAREAVRKTAFNDGVGTLPGKLADCSSKDPEECELFICEGLSAGGTMKMGRDRHFQAVLPLRGKVLNTEKAEIKKVLDNEEIQNIITVLGCGIGRNFDIRKLKYHKVILTMDADVDGQHIRCLVLTLFMRQMPELIEKGHIYIAQPPLFRLTYRNKNYSLKDDRALKKFIKDNELEGKSYTLLRAKGLGEMTAEDLWQTTVNPENRELLKVRIDNYVEADRVFNILMGKDVEPRKDFIMKNAKLAKNIDL